MNFNNFLKKFSKKYVIVTLIFAAVIVVFDQNNVFEQMKTRDKKRRVEAEEKDLTIENEKLNQEKEKINTNPQYIEKTGREKHLMRREDEDAYIFEER